VENECTSHIFGSFAIFLPKIIKIGGNLTQFWQKQICLVFLGDTVYNCTVTASCVCLHRQWKTDNNISQCSVAARLRCVLGILISGLFSSICNKVYCKFIIQCASWNFWKSVSTSIWWISMALSYRLCSYTELRAFTVAGPMTWSSLSKARNIYVILLTPPPSLGR